MIQPHWSTAEHVRSASTTRRGGVSTGSYSSLNLGSATQDAPQAVARNRERLSELLRLPQPWFWLEQVHGTRVVDAASLRDDHTEADAIVAHDAGLVCAVRSADCLPVLFCDDRGAVVAAAHAGWRGLSAGVLEATVDAMGCSASRVRCWLGPAISARHYEVGEEVRDDFMRCDGDDARHFEATRPGHWLADLEGLARARLKRSGVAHISGGGFCTYADAERFYSHRRDSASGRMASLIWISAAP